MYVRILTLTELDTAQLFEMRQYLLGTPDRGDYFVVADDLVLARYEKIEDAQNHLDMLGDSLSKEQMTPEEAIKCANEILRQIVPPSED